MQHEPHPTPLIKTHFDKVVPSAERAEVVQNVATADFGVVGDDGLLAGFYLDPNFNLVRGNIAPDPTVVASSVVGSAVGNGRLNCNSDRLEIVWQVVGLKSCLYRHHLTANIHTHRGGNNRASSRDHATDGGPFPPAHVRHGSKLLVDKR